MITKSDCYILLAELESDGVDIGSTMKTLTNSTYPTKEIIAFINSKRQLDLSKFYESLRKKHNEKKSSLYKNIVKEITDTSEVLTTLSALLLQILLFSKQAEDKEMFFKHARANEISTVLKKYFTDYDLTSCIKLLRYIKADLKCLESK